MSGVFMSGNWLIMGIAIAGVVSCVAADNLTGAIWAATCLMQTIHNQILMSTMRKNNA